MNALDYITIAIILICVAICFSSGLIISIYNLVSLFIAFLLTNRLSPMAGDLLRQTPLLDTIKSTVTGWLGQNVVMPDTERVVADTVNSMSLPNFFKDIIMQNADQIPALDPSGVYEYIADMAAQMAVDAIAMALVFVTVLLLLRIISVVLRIISRLPVIKTFNRIGGGVLGFVIGSMLSWMVLSVMSGIFAVNSDFPVASMLETSFIAKYFIFTQL